MITLRLKALLLYTLATIAGSAAFAKQDDNPALAASAIPAALKTNAHAVIRYANTEVSMEALNRLQYKRSYAVTILDEQGKVAAGLLEHHSQMIKINKIEGTLYDASGKMIRSMKEKDIFDRSTYKLNDAFHSDGRIKVYSFNHTVYPYTVSFEIDETFTSTFFMPRWSPQPDNEYAVEQARFSLSYAPEFKVRYKELLLPPDARKDGKDAEGRPLISWQVRNIPAYKIQPLSATDNYDRPTVLLAPGDFQLMDYKGNMNSWNSFGLFSYQLNDGRSQLPEDKKALVQSIIGTEKDTYKKVQLLYAYMQQNTRYVLNAYGISGWQTFDAAHVAHNGYGDCKGLTNYLKALLAEAGIKSYAALVSAGADYYRLDEQFPANNFNHVILCVPQAKDSIWVECTSQELPAGYLGSFTQNRKVLLTTETGGYLCNTPFYDKDKNYIVRKISVRIDPASEQQQVTMQHTYSGLLGDDIASIVKNKPKDQVREWQNARFSFPSYGIDDYSYVFTGNNGIPALEEKVTAMVSGVITSTQKRTFLNIGWLQNPLTEVLQNEPRTLPLVLRKSFRITDSLLVALPEGSQIESLPEGKSIDYPFASYRLRFEKRAGEVIAIRNYEQSAGVYKPEVFADYQKLYQELNRQKEDMNIVLLNKTP